MNKDDLFKNINTFEELKIAKSKYFSQNGIISKLKQEIQNSDNENKKKLGIEINTLMNNVNQSFKIRWNELIKEKNDKRMSSEWIDVTKPTNVIKPSLHILTKIANQMREWFISNGYCENKVTEITNDESNFEMLNIPKNHPSRDMHDSLYISKTQLLRTHNTGATFDFIKKMNGQDVSVFTIGKVYRNDDDDLTHSHQFMQCDFISIGNESMIHLLSTLKSLLSHIFETNIKMRIRPSYFPFTEPSIEADIFYNNKWIEILGAGMLHPDVLKNANYDDKKIGIAAGIGIERIAMIKYGIDNIREFYKNDLRFLHQFKGII